LPLTSHSPLLSGGFLDIPDIAISRKVLERVIQKTGFTVATAISSTFAGFFTGTQIGVSSNCETNASAMLPSVHFLLFSFTCGVLPYPSGQWCVSLLFIFKRGVTPWVGYLDKAHPNQTPLEV